MSQTATTQLNLLHPDAWYTPSEVAQALRAGPRSVYRAIRAGDLKAAPINGRGDLRILGAWGLAWLERRANDAEWARSE